MNEDYILSRPYLFGQQKRWTKHIQSYETCFAFKPITVFRMLGVVSGRVKDCCPRGQNVFTAMVHYFPHSSSPVPTSPLSSLHL